jgi:hypothetical protein
MSEDPAFDSDSHDELGPGGELDPNALASALRGLFLVGEDPYLTMQVTNLSIIDNWLSVLEDDMARLHARMEGTPVAEAMFLSAQSQMWIFAAYELLRTWRARAKDTLKLAQNGGLGLKITELRKDVGFHHINREMRAVLLERLEADPTLLDRLRDDLRRTHIVFSRMEALRVSLAKHEVVGRPKMMAYAPGYARINSFTGSMQFEVSAGRNIYDEISRRDLANELRGIAGGEPPTDEELETFDSVMKQIFSGRFEDIDEMN